MSLEDNLQNEKLGHSESGSGLGVITDGDVPASEIEEQTNFKRLSSFLSKWGVELRGITPVPIEERVDKRLYHMFFVWFSANFNILSFSTGSAGPVFFSLGVRDSVLVILVVSIITCTIPACCATFGPKLGMRSMVQSRFSWGYYGARIPSFLNVFSLECWVILNLIVGGQTLAAVSDKLNATLGIVIIGIISLVVTFLGCKVIHRYESLVWIPNFIAFLIMLGIGGKHLQQSSYPVVPPAPASAILSFGGLMASSIISWCTITADYGVYHDARASSTRVFIYTYLAFVISNVSASAIGAAFAATAPGVTAYENGFNGGDDIGGLVEAVLAPLGGFGKFLVVVLSLCLPSSIAPTMYTCGTSFMTIHEFFARVPRYMFAIVSTAIGIPLAIVGANTFFETLVDLVSVIGYWTASFGAIVLCEHFVFRRRDYSSYKVENWNKARLLPPGFAAVGAFLCSIVIIVPAMQQTWYTGPIAKAGTGDVGVLTGTFVAAISYAVLRPLEKKWWPTHSS
ncbi:cytosine-purine permease [Pluteus cervinus]|uniref:Cytosine-purine permease n=1 Tax=Pluteus cervinus TaxID=181527 RepID=A0ACD3AWN1_9AGAR|nr:cytosine-purine permease [Pluteus cervinus]